MELSWHPYQYYPYERELAYREVSALFSPATVKTLERSIHVDCRFRADAVDRLVYFASARSDKTETRTMQARLEATFGKISRRQSTRYSAHGLHDYKGKFNPQIARAILNIFRVKPGARVLDPFCGSGTSLVECAHMGIDATGTDINPLAVFIANAKIAALRIPAIQILRSARSAIDKANSIRVAMNSDVERDAYLLRWFDEVRIVQLEQLRLAICDENKRIVPILLSLASNLLREYSLQDPNDLRVRRRKSALPAASILEAFEVAACQLTSRLKDAQSTIGKKRSIAKALLVDSRSLDLNTADGHKESFDCVITSPPYATALPYIDTQRLSLVWLGLTEPNRIRGLEMSLIGSREIGLEKKEAQSVSRLARAHAVPKEQIEFCQMLTAALMPTDGFRRRAVPVLLLRYLGAMSEAFRSIRSHVRRETPFAMIVGTNHTVLGGQRYDINTPYHLKAIGESSGWKHVETLPLETYHRYGYHAKNAINSESLLILRAE